MENDFKALQITAKLQNVHYSAGIVHQGTQQLLALRAQNVDELTTIHHLVESHAPALRQKAILRYEKNITSFANNGPQKLSLSKNCIDFSCSHMKIEEAGQCLLQKIQEMPKEWTIVQLTPIFNTHNNVKLVADKFETNSLFVSVFDCGSTENSCEPFCMFVEAPVDSVNGTRIEIAQEMQAIVAANKEALLSIKSLTSFKNPFEKHTFISKRIEIDNRLRGIKKDLQDLYLREWRCLLSGKFVNQELEFEVKRQIREKFMGLDQKSLGILQYLVKNCHVLKDLEFVKGAQFVFPGDQNSQKTACAFAKELSHNLALSVQKKHPLLLIIDDTLDSFPWEMIDILEDQPVSRLPSLHLAYALFKEHKSTIKDGFKIIKNPQNGTFIINPDLDLKNMENRISSFVDYWLPEWTGVVGCKPTVEQFEQMLTSGEIFTYNGHGSGSHFYNMEKIQRLKIKSVVLLFGCGSTKLTYPGPQVEPFGAYQMYLIACSPCVVGMLWEVTDLDTDLLTTEFISLWIENDARRHWKSLDISQWKRGLKVDFNKLKVFGENSGDFKNNHEPELLRALCLAKKAKLSYYTTKAACVARGIPVKIRNND